MRTTIRARLSPCPHCRAATIRGLTEPPAAWTAITDPVPLTPPAELAALAAGKFTYDLVTIASRPQLIHRDQHRILTRDWPVLATHQCPGPVPFTAIPPQCHRKENNDNGTIPF